jgi:transcriptional regulator with PAS, ATPase and Fis domain
LPFPREGFALKDYTDCIIREVLNAHGGNQMATATYLGISLRTLAYRIAKTKKTDNN